MKVLIIGLGSIAQKHIAALKKINPNCLIYALRSSKSSPHVHGVRSCYSLSEVPVDIRFVIISNPTSLHLQTIYEVSHFHVPIFIEKPPFDSLGQMSELTSLIETLEVSTYTAFNLRFHPVIKWLKENIGYHRTIEVNVYCGSYLPDWRPFKDYRKIYSARNDLGGGVHLDLSHEIDYILWIFGKPASSMSKKRKISDLDVDSVDNARYWFDYEKFNINLVLNYYRRDPMRMIEIVTNETTLECDLISNKVTDLIRKEVIFESRDFSISDTYELQMQYFIDSISKNKLPMNDLSESIQTMEFCLK